MFRSVAITLTLCLVAATAQAALLSRAGGQAYYDDVLNITWLADAHLAYTNKFGVTGINPYDGTMTWDKAQEWISAMNTANYLGTSTWRLPTIIDTGTSGCNFAYTGTDCGFNVDLSTSEMAHMFYSTLGNVGVYNTSGSTTGCSQSSPWCLTNTGPFSNLRPHIYWSGTTYAPISSRAWGFYFDGGRQGEPDKSGGYNAWAVSPGDTLAPVPVPSAVWLFGSALGLMGWIRGKAIA
jgi:Protein of unknown function (DUF1566)